MDVAILVTMFLMVSFWAYCNLFYAENALPHRQGYLIFANFQWLIVGINLVRMFGWVIGLVALVILIAFGAILITNFTTNQIYRFVFKMDPMLPLVFFSTSVWVNAALTAIAIIS